MTTATLSASDLPPPVEAGTHRFAKRMTAAKAWEIAFTWVFRLATYVILLWVWSLIDQSS